MRGTKFLGYKKSIETISRESGYLYYIGKDGFLWASPLKSNKTGKKKKVGKVKHKKEWIIIDDPKHIAKVN